jgi:hypothetical protein
LVRDVNTYRRYSSSPESEFDRDIRQIHAQGIEKYAEDAIQGELSDAFWETVLPQALDTSVASSPYFNVFRAAQVRRMIRASCRKTSGFGS